MMEAQIPGGNIIPIIGKSQARQLSAVTLPQPDGSTVQVPAAAVVAASPEFIASVARAVIGELFAALHGHLSGAPSGGSTQEAPKEETRA